MDQRSELARQFRETYAARQDDGSDYPFVIGVFDTVAAMASKGALSILSAAVLALAAVMATALWAVQPAAGRLVGPAAGRGALWCPWFWAVLGGFALSTFVWYVITQIKFAPSVDPRNPLRTLSISFRRMRFEDLTLNDNVRYARHAISIDEKPGGLQARRLGLLASRASG